MCGIVGVIKRKANNVAKDLFWVAGDTTSWTRCVRYACVW